MCGGADADIYIDGILYDFKSSKEFGYRWQDIAQLIGYYLLDQISKKHADENNMLYKHKIDAVAFYKARYGEIEYYNVAPLERGLELTIIKIEKLLEPQLDIAKERVAFIDAQNELERDQQLRRKLVSERKQKNEQSIYVKVIIVLIIIFVFMWLDGY